MTARSSRTADSEGDEKPLADFNSQGRENRISNKNGSMPAMKIGNRKIKMEKTSPMKKKSPLNISSVSRKVIGEFRKSALEKYQLPPPSSPCSPNSSTREWQVLYTTQITQKTKKYHDGILRLIMSGLRGRQVMLYDTSRKLLDSKFLKTDEIIESGQSLRLDVHLVDIGEPEQNQDSQVNLNVQPSNCNKAGQTEMLHGQYTILKRNKTIAAVAGTAHAILEVPHSTCASGLNAKAGAGESLKQTSSMQWQVLYTTQIAQKSKKYHDGILQLTNSGVQRRQVMLYDTSGKLLDRMFLKKDEIIESGLLLRLDAHLVDIGELGQSQESPVNFNVQSSNCSAAGQTEMPHGQYTILQHNKIVTTDAGASYSVCGNSQSTCAIGSNNKTDVGESFKKTTSRQWQVLYTTQITQKSKKYNDGILQLATSGLQGRQVMLYDTSEKLLDRKFLKKDEIIESGQTLRLDAHLVDVGEPEQNQASPANFGIQPSNCNKVGQAEILDAKPQHDASSRKGLRLSFSSFIADNIKLRNKPLRDTYQILSGLKIPKAVSIDTCDAEANMEQSWASPCLDMVQCDLQDLVRGQSDQDPHETGRSTLENSKGAGTATIEKDSQPTISSHPNDGLNRNADAGVSLELTASIPVTQQMGSQFSKGIKIEKSLQSHAGTEGNYRSPEGVSSRGLSSSSADASLSSSVMEAKCSGEHENNNNFDDCPSFDLMF